MHAIGRCAYVFVYIVSGVGVQGGWGMHMCMYLCVWFRMCVCVCVCACPQVHVCVCVHVLFGCVCSQVFKHNVQLAFMDPALKVGRGWEVGRGVGRQ